MATASAGVGSQILTKVFAAKMGPLLLVAVASGTVAAGLTVFVTGHAPNPFAGPPGSTGTAGPSGASGAPGPAGTGSTWGTLTLSFGLGGKATGLSIAKSSCALQGHGAYACDVVVASTAALPQKVTGLSYTPSPNLYYAGANPTLGAVLLPSMSNTEFTLWFQAVQPSGNTIIDVTLLVVPAPGA